MGKLADVAGAGERDVILERALSWDGLLRMLEPELAEALAAPAVRMAQNGALVADKTALAALPEDELAFLPPVSGG